MLLGRECVGNACALDAGPGPSIDASSDAGSCVAASGDASSCACEVGATRILAHWSLDERGGLLAHDPVGGNDGLLQHAPSQSPWATGRVDGALSFDGVDDAVNVGAVPGSLRAVSLWLLARSTQLVTSRTPLRLPASQGPLSDWYEPEKAYADDNVSATVARLIGSEAQQHWGGFHLAQVLPRDATILGLTVTVDTGNLGVLGGLSVELSWDGGTSHTQSRYGWGQLIVGTNLRQAGGSDKLWGRSWSPDDFTDGNFRVRATFNGIVNAMSLDYVGVEVEYAAQMLSRTILGLSRGVYLGFAGDGLQIVGWPATTYVNGAANGPLRNGWNHVAVVGTQPIVPTDVRLGAATLETLSHPLDGVLDEVLLFSEPLTSQQIAGLARAPLCTR